MYYFIFKNKVFFLYLYKVVKVIMPPTPSFPPGSAVFAGKLPKIDRNGILPKWKENDRNVVLKIEKKNEK